MKLKIILVMLSFVILGACTSDTPSGDVAAEAVEDYLTAKIAGDRDSVASLICSELESTIDREAASFASVEASLEDMSCSSDGNTVSCAGQIIALYGTENREFPLTTYQVVQEDGEWRWCGEGN